MKARVIVTLECNRHCEGCSNTHDAFLQHEVLDNIRDLLSYEEIIITGGEPMLIPDKVILFAHVLRRRLNYEGKIYMYTALFKKDLWTEYRDLFTYINGIHFTIHDGASDQDVMELKLLSERLPQQSGISFRLDIDTRLYERYDFSNINFSAWSVVRRLKWLDNCKLPEEEKLFIFDLKGA